MASVYFPFSLYPAQILSSTSVQTTLIDDTNKVAIGFRARSAEAITGVWLNLTAVTTGTRTINVALQNNSGHDPDGSDVAAITPVACSTLSTGFQEFTFSSSHTPTAGDELCIVVETDTTGTGDITVGRGWSTVKRGPGQGEPWSQQYTGTWGAPDTEYQPIYAVVTASRTYGFPFTGQSSLTASSTGDRVAIKFTMPTDTCSSFKLEGFGAQSNAITSGTYVAGCWQTSSALASATHDATFIRSGGTLLFRNYRFGETGALSAGTPYYVGLERGATNVTLETFTVDSASHLAFCEGAMPCATYNGSWSDEATHAVVGQIYITDLTSGGGGGGGGDIYYSRRTMS